MIGRNYLKNTATCNALRCSELMAYTFLEIDCAILRSI
jgi:hypothetical protein